MFSVFGRTGAPLKRGPDRPENVGHFQSCAGGLSVVYCEFATIAEKAINRSITFIILKNVAARLLMIAIIRLGYKK